MVYPQLDHSSDAPNAKNADIRIYTSVDNDIIEDIHADTQIPHLSTA